MTKYTAEDYAQEQFARHEDGRIAARTAPRGVWPWEDRARRYTDAEMAAASGWRIVRDAESLTAREHLDAAWEKAHETDVIPAGVGCIVRYSTGATYTLPEGYPRDRPAKFDEGAGRRLLDPPPAPAWHTAQIIRATHVADDSPSKWARTEVGDWVRLSAASGYTSADADLLRDVTVIVGEVDR